MKILNFDYWMKYREPFDFQDVKDYIEDLIEGRATGDLFRKNLNNGIVERFNPRTTFWEKVE